MIRRLIDRLLRWFLLLLLAIAGLLAYLLFTESGSRNIERLAMHYLPQLSIEEPGGRILGDYRIGKLTWKDAEVTAVAEEVELEMLAASLLKPELDVRRLKAGKVSVDLQARQQAPEEPATAFEMPIDLRLHDAAVGQIDLVVDGKRYSLERLQLEQAELAGSRLMGRHLSLETKLEGRRIALTLSGTAGLAESLAFDLKAGAATADEQFGAIKLDAAVAGTPDAYSLTATATGNSDSYGENSLRLEARGDTTGLQISSALLDGDNGKADLVGTLGWQQQLEWQADLRLTNFRTALLLPDFPAQLSGTAASMGKLVDGKPEFGIDLRGIEGELRGYPVAARGTAFISDGRAEVRSFDVSTGDNSLRANGSIGDELDLVFELDARQLDQLLPQLAGKVTASGKLGGNFEKPRVEAVIGGKGLVYETHRIEAVDLALTTEGGKVTARGRLQELFVGGQPLAEVTIDASGTPAGHKLVLAATHEFARVSTELEGGLKETQWQGSVNKFAIEEKRSGRWQLKEPTRLTVSQQHVETGELCLQNGDASLCSSHRWDREKGVTSSGQAGDLPLALAQPFLPSSTGLAGTLGFDYALKLADGKPAGTLGLEWPAGSLTLKDESGRGRRVGFDAGKATLVLEDSRLQAEGAIRLPGYAAVDAKATVDLDFAGGRHRIEADLDANSKDIAWLDEFIPEAQLLKGGLDGNARVTGLLADPAVNAEVRLSGGQLRIDRTGETLDDIGLVLRTIGDNRFGIDGSLRAGKGVLTVKGDMSLTGKRWSSRLAIKGTELALLDSHEIKVRVAPDILLEASPEKVVMSGTVLVPQAAIRLTTLPKTAVVESGDVVIVGRGRPKRRPPGEGLAFEPRLKVVLGDRVRFSGYGLDARLKGEFRLSQVKDKLITDGFLTIHDGIYEVYGQKLQIDSGRLIFNGPLDNPGVNLRIVRKLRDVTVGLNVTGTLQMPESSIFSTPPMSETEAFSYLLTGGRLSGASAVQGAMLMNAAKSLGLKGGGSFVSKLGAGLGLDEASISAEGGFEESELLLGKRIGKDLYVKYVVGLLDGLQKLAVEYRLNDRLRVEAETGTENSVDLIYKLERD